MVPLVVVLLAIAGVVAAQQGLFSGDSTTVTAPTVMATAPTVMATALTATASPASSPSATASTTPKPSTTPSQQASSAAQHVLAGCREMVKAADRTLAAADVGVGHWSEHVQAQTDADHGKISLDKMDAIFKRTRLAGPDDVAEYEGAVMTQRRAKATCDAPAGAAATVQKQLSRCAERSEQQRQVLQAAQQGMDDWESHLEAMQRSRMGHVHDAQAIWIRAWRAAPPHIRAYDKAVHNFAAPSC